MMLDSWWWFFLFWGLLALLASAEWQAASPARSLLRRGRWPANLGLGFANGLLVALLPVSVLAIAFWAEQKSLGLFNILELPVVLVVAATLVLRSFAQYLQHRLMHRVPLLWRVHRVHHCDPRCDVTTALRFHPLEYAVVLPLLGGLTLLGGLDPYTLAVYEIVESIFGLATHACLQLPGRLERVLRLVFVTPAVHQIHHSIDRDESEMNYAAVFSLWDRLFGSFQALPSVPMDERRFGCDQIAPAQASSFDQLMDMPFRSRAYTVGQTAGHLGGDGG